MVGDGCQYAPVSIGGDALGVEALGFGVQVFDGPRSSSVPAAPPRLSRHLQYSCRDAFPALGVKATFAAAAREVLVTVYKTRYYQHIRGVDDFHGARQSAG